MVGFFESKQRKLNHDKVKATNLLINAKCDLFAGDFSAKNRIERLESELQAFNLMQNETFKIRSRAQWLEGEKALKYFFTLKSTSVEKNAVNLFKILTGMKSQHNEKLKMFIMIFIGNYIIVKPQILKFRANFCRNLILL